MFFSCSVPMDYLYRLFFTNIYKNCFCSVLNFQLHIWRLIVSVFSPLDGGNFVFNCRLLLYIILSSTDGTISVCKSILWPAVKMALPLYL